jgi:thioredoxin-like negative regulator of GroEL
MTEKDSFASFIPFRRDLKTPCLLFCKWNSCGHCHDMAPHMKKSQMVLRSTMPVYVVDAEQHSKVIDHFKVTGFPEVFFLGRDRKLRKYKGPRNADSIIAFAKHYKNE